MPDLIRVLVISNDQRVCHLVQSTLTSEGHVATCVSNPQDALTIMRDQKPFELVIFDTTRQPPSKMHLLGAASAAAGNHRMCLLSALGSSSWNADAERAGIQHIFRKPFLRHDLEQLLDQMGSSLRAEHSTADPLPSPKAQSRSYHLEELPNGRYFLAAAPAMLKIWKTIRLLAPVDVPVLILGESGVGKDVISNLLHNYSVRSQQSYLSVNCAALPAELLESELFGYEAGAFTGAVKAKPGKFELAHKGTILLDEIGEMSAPMQAKLLHVLQDGQFSRLGARTTTRADVRVLAATNVNIDAAIADRSFREDLYYRLSAFTITVPPLRERREEIPFFVEEMARRHAATLRQEPFAFSPSLVHAIQEHSWPGNLRELSNFVIRCLILQDEESALQELRSRIKLSRRTTTGGDQSTQEIQAKDAETMRAIVRNQKNQTESRLIQEALDAAGWNRRHAAMQLNISYRGLLYKIQQYGIGRSSERLSLR